MEKARSYIREHLAEKLTLTIVAKADNPSAIISVMSAWHWPVSS